MSPVDHVGTLDTVDGPDHVVVAVHLPFLVGQRDFGRVLDQKRLYRVDVRAHIGEVVAVASGCASLAHRVGDALLQAGQVVEGNETPSAVHERPDVSAPAGGLSDVFERLAAPGEAGGVGFLDSYFAVVCAVACQGIIDQVAE